MSGEDSSAYEADVKSSLEMSFWRCPELEHLLLQEIELDATCFICHEGDSSLAAFLIALPKLESVKLRSDARAVNYHSALSHLSGVKRKQWEAL